LEAGPWTATHPLSYKSRLLFPPELPPLNRGGPECVGEMDIVRIERGRRERQNDERWRRGNKAVSRGQEEEASSSVSVALNHSH